MPDPQDIVEIPGIINPATPHRRCADTPHKKWLGVWYTCCHTYGRMMRNREGTLYEGGCPKCGARVKALIGEGGTSRRFFKTE